LRGYDRTIVLAEGAGFTLTFADGTRTTFNRLGARCDFAGETMPGCSLLAGGVQAFNVMTYRDTTRAEVEVTHRQPHVAWRERGPAYVFVIAGEIASGAETIREAVGGRFTAIVTPRRGGCACISRGTARRRGILRAAIKDGERRR
jgi:environmental stress-induced protein Ves